MSEYSSCLSQFSSDHSSKSLFSNGTSKYQKNVFFSFYTAFPLRFTDTKKKVVCSVSNAKTTVDK